MSAPCYWSDPGKGPASPRVPAGAWPEAAEPAGRHLAGSLLTAGYRFEWHELEAVCPLKWSWNPRAESAELCLNLEGNGWVATGTDRIDLSPGTAGFFNSNGRPLAAERASTGWHRFLIVHFSAAFLQSQLGPHASNLHPAIRSCLDRKTAPALSKVLRLNRRHHELLANLLQPPVLAAAQALWYKSKALEFASEFFFPFEAEGVRSRAGRLAADRVGCAKAILAEDLCHPPTLEELGRRVACSPFYLSRTFSRETGLTISQWLRQARLEKAAALLKEGRCNVTEAAFAVGYSSLSHFSMAFHEQFGCCPGLYPLRTRTQRRPA